MYVHILEITEGAKTFQHNTVSGIDLSFHSTVQLIIYLFLFCRTQDFTFVDLNFALRKLDKYYFLQ